MTSGMALLWVFALCLSSCAALNIKPVGYSPRKSLKMTECYGKQRDDSTDTTLYISTQEVRKVVVRSGEMVDSVQLGFANGLDSIRVGGDGGNEETWTVPEGEYISQIIITNDVYINSLRFVTNKGTSSNKFGTGNGTQSTFVLPPKNRLFGIRGYVENGLLTGINFYYKFVW